MTRSISARVIIDRFNNGKTDFKDLGNCKVDGEVKLDNITLGSMINLGDLRFNSFDCGNAIFASEFHCDIAQIDFFRAGKAQFQLFDLQLSTINFFAEGRLNLRHLAATKVA